MIVYSTGYYIAYWHQTTVIKQQMQSLISSGNFNSNNLFTITIPIKNGISQGSDFELISNKEIRYHGELYDIIKTEKKNNEIIFTCLSDKKENQINIAFSKQLKQQHESKPDKKNTSLKFSYDCIFANKIELATELNNPHFTFNILNNNVFATPYQNIPSPPPWRILA